MTHIITGGKKHFSTGIIGKVVREYQKKDHKWSRGTKTTQVWDGLFSSFVSSLSLVSLMYETINGYTDIYILLELEVLNFDNSSRRNIHMLTRSGKYYTTTKLKSVNFNSFPIHQSYGNPYNSS